MSDRLALANVIEDAGIEPQPPAQMNTAMARVDVVALQQRLVQQPKPATPVPDEPPSWTARLATASAAAPAGTLRATTTMRAALPLRSTKARAERAEERARVDALRTQIDELNAALVVARAEAERALTQEQARADRLSDPVDPVQRDLDAARADVVMAERRADAADTDRRVAQARLEHAEAARDQAEVGREAERVRDALRDRIEALQAQFELATHARQEVVDAAEAIRQADDQRLRLGRWARLRRAWTGK